MKIGKIDNQPKVEHAYTLEDVIKLKDNNHFIKQLLIAGKEYSIDLQPVVSLMKPLNELNDLEIDEGLMIISSHRFTFISIESELGLIKSELDRKFKIWFAEVSNRKRIEMSVKRKNGLSYGTRATISEKEVYNEIITDPELGEQWNARLKNIDSLDRQITLVAGINRILEQRARTLEAVAKRRYEFKHGKGRNSGI